MFVTPHTVGSLGTFVDLSFRVREYKPNVKVGVLFLYEQMFLSICYNKPTLALNDDTVGKFEVRCVLPCLIDMVFDLHLFVLNWNRQGLELLRDAIL